ncbi:hypothetical protein Tco_0829187, partial [Tanacetum coccineum]
KLLQLGTVEDYQREFEKLMNRVMDIPDSLLIAFYISGLKLNLQHELLVSRPTTLGNAFSLAQPNFKIQEKVVEYVKALNVAPLKVVFAAPVDEVSSVIEDVFYIDESNVEGMQVRDKFAEFFKDKGSVEKVLSATKLPEGGNSQSTYSPYHLEDKAEEENGYWSRQRKAVRDGLG